MDDLRNKELPFPEEVWSQLARESLTSVGGDSQMVVGAKLRQKMVELGNRRHVDTRAFIDATGASFLSLIERVPEVVVHRRRGSDALVGLVGASEPKPPAASPSRRGALRRDVYEAFTRVAASPFVYETQSDRFVSAESAEGPVIEVPRVNLEILKADRRTFVEALPENERPPFLDALDHSINPLATFRRRVEEAAILHKWGADQARIIWQRVAAWAQANDVVPRETWLSKHQAPDSAHQVLGRLAPYLTPTEIRDLAIPFRAVEALLADLERR